MKQLISLLFCIIFVSCINAPHYAAKNPVHEKLKADEQERDFDLQVKTVSLSEKDKNKEVEIEYELKNNSKVNIFDQTMKTYKLFFILKMKEGREIAKEKTIWSVIPPNTSIIQKEKIYISNYNIESYTINVYTKYK